MTGNNRVQFRSRAIFKSRERNASNAALAAVVAAMRRSSSGDDYFLSMKRKMDEIRHQTETRLRTIGIEPIRLDNMGLASTRLDNTGLASTSHIARQNVSLPHPTACGFGNLVVGLEEQRLASLRAMLGTYQAACPGSKVCPICIDYLLNPRTVIGKYGLMNRKRRTHHHLARGGNDCTVCRKRMEIEDLLVFKNRVAEKERDEEDVKLVIGMLEDKLKMEEVEESALERSGEKRENRGEEEFGEDGEKRNDFDASDKCMRE